MVGYGFFCENVDRLADDDDEDYCCSQKEIKIKAHNRSQRLAAQADHLKTMSHRFGKNSKEDYDISKQFCFGDLKNLLIEFHSEGKLVLLFCLIE